MRRAVLGTALTAGAVSAGVVAAVLPTLAAIAFAAIPFATLLVLASPGTRLLIVLVGALLVFESESAVSKSAYLAAAGLSAVVAAGNLLRQHGNVTRIFAPTLVAGAAFGLVVAASSLVALSEGISAGSWARDVLPYMMLVTLPIVALDAAPRLTLQQVDAVVWLAGAAASVSLTLAWLGKRNAVEGAEGFLLTSTVLVLLAFSFAFVRTALGPLRGRWAVLLALTATAGVLSGSRSTVALMLVIVLATVGHRARARVPAARAAVIGAAVGGSVAVAALLVSPLLADGYLDRRIDSFRAVLTQPESDLSYQLRQAQSEVAKARWERAPWFGSGPGYAYPNAAALFGTPEYDEPVTYTLDTPWIVPAKFGVLGTGVLVCYFGAIVASVRRLHHATGGPHWTTTAVVAFGLMLAARTPFGPWVEDKGTALAVTLSLTALVSARAALIGAGNTAAAASHPDRGTDATARTPGDHPADPNFSCTPPR